jgi:polysaccharide export outer membrane protein
LSHWKSNPDICKALYELFSSRSKYMSKTLGVFLTSLAMVTLLGETALAEGSVVQTPETNEEQFSPIPSEPSFDYSDWPSDDEPIYQDPSVYQEEFTLLKSGDRIAVTVAGFPELSGEHTVLADGSIQLPMAGRVFVSRRTPSQVSDLIAQSLLPYVRYPQVGITLVSLRPGRVLITGEVRNPGIHSMVRPDGTNNSDGENNEIRVAEGYQTLSYVLQLAGGIKPQADLRNIVVRRAINDEQVALARGDNAQTEIQINLWQALREGDLDADIRIYDGDEIIVPVATEVNASEQQLLLDSTFAPEAVTVLVGGEVRSPGEVTIQASDGINAAIAAAGGLNDGADNLVHLLRVGPNGEAIREDYRFGEEESGPLLDGDVVVVDLTAGRRTLNFFGRLAAPLGILRLFGL